MVFCGKCGKELSEMERFCPKCGQSVQANYKRQYQSRSSGKETKIALIIVVLVLIAACALGLYVHQQGKIETRILGTWYIVDQEANTVTRSDYITFFNDEIMTYTSGTGTYHILNNEVIIVTDGDEWNAKFDDSQDELVREFKDVLKVNAGSSVVKLVKLM